MGTTEFVASCPEEQVGWGPRLQLVSEVGATDLGWGWGLGAGVLSQLQAVSVRTGLNCKTPCWYQRDLKNWLTGVGKTTEPLY